MVKYATALRLGTTDSESILKRFTKNNLQHLTYQALSELGRAILIQDILSEEEWFNSMEKEDFRAITPLIYGHVNPYGNFKLDMDKRIHLEVQQNA